MSSSAKKIAANTIVMYVRMLLLIGISFIASRYLLKTLGIEDYGIYSVVGSVAATFVSLKTLFSESIQRFLNYEKGKDSIRRQEMIYTISVIIHLILAIIFVVIVELVGLWLINHKLVIPAEKLDTAIFVFHFSVLSMVIGIISIPYDALIIANEKMTFFALISIFDGILRLVIIILIPLIPFEYLRSYALLMVVIQFITLVLLFVYCKKNFKECRLSSIRDNKLIKSIFSLSGWNFFGNLSFSLLHEGINLLLNTFGGLVLNAARSVSYQVKNVAVQFNNNTLVAVRPAIMQNAAISSVNQIFSKIILISKISFYSVLVLVVPLIVCSEKLLSIWLVEVPQKSGLFTQLILIAVLVRSLHEPLNILYMSIGKIKKMMIIEAVIMVGTFLLAYIFLKMGAGITSVFCLIIIMEIIIIISLVVNAKNELGVSASLYFNKVLLSLMIIVIQLSPLVVLGLIYFQFESFISTVLFFIFFAIATCFVVFINMKSQERELLRKIIS